MKRRMSDEGAAAVEFALVAPLVIMLVMGIFTGGLAYMQKMSLTHAAREAARYGATIPTGTTMATQSWLDTLHQRAVDSADGDIKVGTGGEAGHYVCVAYVGYGSPRGSSVDFTHKRQQTGTGSAVYTLASSCFSDGRGTEPRVQVRLERPAQFSALLFVQTLTLTSDAVARYEALSS